MQINSLLNFFIGMTLTFGCFSLIVSSVVEAVSSAMAWRANNLVDGIRKMLNDRNLGALVNDVLNHAAVNPFSPGAAAGGAASGAPATKPSYVEPLHFAAALIDAVKAEGVRQSQAGAPDKGAAPQPSLRDAIAQLPDDQIRTYLASLYDAAGNDEKAFQAAVASWFNSSMDRLSGVYKRKTQIWGFCIALAMAVLLNIDAVHIAKALWADPKLATAIAAPARPEDYQAMMKSWSASFPFGWPQIYAEGVGWLLLPLGWAITASAALFGAPFWFDTLQRFVQLRGTGPAPGESKSMAAQTRA
ncbi:hypothetical protein [Limobrevibacterium gyesilva]|uniref:Uncharacterized protein n=1 Tax=Limobrevibacterium gyesilva TaxID=2991712 RepID=A0AA41YNI4_9PROT|nr:hypothetical protein [Limobrevibacterium gyesilva]MCW3473753.1 hypothetical protein [Limobrevibacterium gyesilva]